MPRVRRQVNCRFRAPAREDGPVRLRIDLAYDGSGWAAEFKNLVGLRCLHPKANFAIKATS